MFTNSISNPISKQRVLQFLCHVDKCRQKILIYWSKCPPSHVRDQLVHDPSTGMVLLLRGETAKLYTRIPDSSAYIPMNSRTSESRINPLVNERSGNIFYNARSCKTGVDHFWSTFFIVSNTHESKK